jgi:hypothetical protein
MEFVVDKDNYFCKKDSPMLTLSHTSAPYGVFRNCEHYWPSVVLCAALNTSRCRKGLALDLY